MSAPEIYDKAKYHFEGDYPKGLSKQQSYVHTGFFLGWLVDHDLISNEIQDQFRSELEKFRDRKLSPSSLFRLVGGTLDETMLTSEGNIFARHYFDFEKGQYVEDYQELLVRDLPSFYHVEDNWENYEVISRRVDERWNSLRSGAR